MGQHSPEAAPGGTSSGGEEHAAPIAEMLTDRERMLMRVGRRVISHIKLSRFMTPRGIHVYEQDVWPLLREEARKTGVSFHVASDDQRRLEHLYHGWNHAGALRIGELALEYEDAIFELIHEKVQALTAPSEVTVMVQNPSALKPANIDRCFGIRVLHETDEAQLLADELGFELPQLQSSTAGIGWIIGTDDPRSFLEVAQRRLEGHTFGIEYGIAQLLRDGEVFHS